MAVQRRTPRAAPRRFLRIGQGFDIHRLVEGRRLRLGGIDIEHERGLLGHSDGDAVLHAVTDAILGAMAAGDIGSHFPDSDPRFHAADSAQLLGEVVAVAQGRGFAIVNVDITILAERPRLGPVFPAMRSRIAGLLGTPEDAVSLKAKTMEGLGAIGNRDAIAAIAVVLLEQARSVKRGHRVTSRALRRQKSAPARPR